MSPFTRKLLMFALIYTSVEGLVINMTFPSKIGFLVKDAALMSAYMLLMGGGEQRQVGSLSRFNVAIGIFALVQTMYLLFPSDLPLLARLVGWKMRLLYVPTMLLAYWYLRSFDDYRRFALVMTIVAIPVSIFGIYLYFVGPTFLRSMGGTYSAMVYSTTGVWRVPGTFTSPGQYGLYLTFNCMLAMSLLLSGKTGGSMKVVVWAGISIMLLAMMASGSRTPLVLTLAGIGLATVALRRVGRLFSITFVLYAVFAVGFATFGAGVADRVDSIASMDHATRFRDTYFGQLFLSQLLEEPMGIGLGMATIGARHFTEFRQIVFVESYLGIVAIETGLIGLGALLWLLATLILGFWKSRPVMALAPETAAAWHVLALFAMMVILLLPVGTLLDAAPGNMYFWLSVGMAAKLYDLERARLASGLAGPPQFEPSLSPYAPWPAPPSRTL